MIESEHRDPDAGLSRGDLRFSKRVDMSSRKWETVLLALASLLEFGLLSIQEKQQSVYVCDFPLCVCVLHKCNLYWFVSV